MPEKRLNKKIIWVSLTLIFFVFILFMLYKHRVHRLQLNNTQVSQQTTSVDQSKFTNISDLLSNLVKSGQLSGVELVIVKNNTTVYSQSFGNLDKNSVVKIDSSSKMPSVSAIMTLVDQGKLSLDDKVGKYLSYWPADKSSITIRQLLSHTAGFSVKRPSCHNDSSFTLDQCARQIANMPLQIPPGTGFIYSGTDYQVAGAVAEKVSGQSWNTFFQNSIATPCQLQTFKYPSDSNPWIAGQAMSNLEDYGKILNMLLSGGMCGTTQVLSQQSIDTMKQDELSTIPITSSPFPNSWHYGLGWWINSATPNIVSDQGAGGMIPWIDNERQYGAFLLMVSTTRKGISTYSSLLPLINEDLQ